MKKIVLNISDAVYEKLRFEAIHEQKSVQDLLKERVFDRPFPQEVEEAYEEWVAHQIQNILEE